MRVDFVAWLWKGWRPVYELRHVRALYSMLQATQPYEWTLTLATDQWPQGEAFPLQPVRTVPLPTSPLDARTGVNCYRRLRLWDEAWRDSSGLRGDIVVSIDLDSIVTASLEHMLGSVVSFGGIRGAFSLVNGSMWAIRQQPLAPLPPVWERFIATPETLQKNCSRRRLFNRASRSWINATGHIGSDQAIMSHLLEDHAPMVLWDTADGIRVWREHSAPLEPAAMQLLKHERPAALWTFPGHVKPWSPQVLSRRPDLYHHYQTHLGQRAS